jgi:hypothetical protein
MSRAAIKPHTTFFIAKTSGPPDMYCLHAGVVRFEGAPPGRYPAGHPAGRQAARTARPVILLEDRQKGQDYFGGFLGGGD